MIKRIISIVLIIAASFSINGNLFAKDIIVDRTVKLHLGTFSNTVITIQNIKKSMDVRNLQISDSSICTVMWNRECSDSIFVYPKKAGECYVSGDIYDGTKMIKHFSTRIVLYKHKNPFKKLKIGKKNYTKKFKKYKEFTLKKKKNKMIKVSVKLKKGFNKLKIYYCQGSNYKRIKNNKYFKTTKKKNQYISIEVHDKKVKTNDEYIIYIR